MKRVSQSVILVFAGVLLGWWLRDLAVVQSLPQQDSLISPATTDSPTAPPVTAPAGPRNSASDSMPMLENAGPPTVEGFVALLNDRKFQQAISYYESALIIDENYQLLMKPRLDQYLVANVEQCADGVFFDLVELWLESYYQDISVLLLLSEKQRLCSSPEEAASTLQIASAYAIKPGERERITAAVGRLVSATEVSYSKQQRWVELLGFYEFLQAIDLATRNSELRRASLYQRLGEVQRSRELLVDLRESDDGLDPEWTAALDVQLVSSTPQSSDDNERVQAIPISRRGDHFLVSVSINEISQVDLIVDTGASLTTLSAESFARIDRNGLGYRGSRLFNTPNGITQGDVYQTTSITLGNTRSSGLEIAVLDYPSPQGVDGLLGMNVLRNYRFEIDQDRDILYLRPR